MDALLRFIPLLVALFVIINGIYILFMPPAGDELTGTVIIAAGFAIIAAVLLFPWIRKRFGQE